MLLYENRIGRRSDEGSRRGQGVDCPGPCQCLLSDQQSGHLCPQTAGFAGRADQRYGVLDQPPLTGVQQHRKYTVF